MFKFDNINSLIQNDERVKKKQKEIIDILKQILLTKETLKKMSENLDLCFVVYEQGMKIFNDALFKYPFPHSDNDTAEDKIVKFLEILENVKQDMIREHLKVVPV